MVIVPLGEILKEINLTSSSHAQKAEKILALKEALTDFRCPQNIDVQSFLNNNAVDYDLIHRAKTYLCFENAKLVAYYSLTIKTLEISDRVEKKFIQKLCYGLTKTKHIPAYLIAQIGKDFRYAPDGMMEDLIDAAFQNIKAAQNQVGGRIIYLEFEKGNERLSKLYTDNGFRYLQSTDKHDQMVLITTE